MLPRLKNKDVNLRGQSDGGYAVRLADVLVLESQVVAGKTPTNIIRVPMVAVWQDAPHDRIIHAVGWSQSWS